MPLFAGANVADKESTAMRRPMRSAHDGGQQGYGKSLCS